MESKFIDISDSGFNPVPTSGQNLLQLFPVVENEISYEEFFRNHLLKNLPCLIKSNDFIKTWPSFTDWINAKDVKWLLRTTYHIGKAVQVKTLKNVFILKIGILEETVPIIQVCCVLKQLKYNLEFSFNLDMIKGLIFGVKISLSFTNKITSCDSNLWQTSKSRSSAKAMCI